MGREIVMFCTRSLLDSMAAESAFMSSLTFSSEVIWIGSVVVDSSGSGSGSPASRGGVVVASAAVVVG